MDALIADKYYSQVIQDIEDQSLKLDILAQLTIIHEARTSQDGKK